jgi:hypothetical protein
MQSKEKMAKRIHYYDQAVATSKIQEAKQVLAKYPSGKVFLEEINGKNPYNAPLEIKLTTADQLMRLSGFDGGTIVSRKNAPAYIILNGDAPADSLAHMMVHESQHVIDDYQTDNYLEKHVDLKAKIENAAKKIREGHRDQLNAEEQTGMRYAAAALLCFEARAYTRNMVLDKEGLKGVSNAMAAASLGSAINEFYLKKADLTLPADPDEMVKACLAKPTIVDFLGSLNL